MEGRIIGPPVPILLFDGDNIMRAHLSIAVETDEKKCVPALLPEYVYPAMNAKVQLHKRDVSDVRTFQYVITV